MTATQFYNFLLFATSSLHALQVRLVIPEGLELSKLFYLWLSSTLSRYLGEGVTEEERHIFRENVFGISLSATGLSEVSIGSVRCVLTLFRFRVYVSQQKILLFRLDASFPARVHCRLY